MSDVSPFSKKVLSVNFISPRIRNSKNKVSFLLDDEVRLCPVIVNSICIPNSCIFHIAKTALLRCCLHTPVGYSRPPSAFKRPICHGVGWILESHLLRFSPKYCKQRCAPIDHKPLLASSFLTFCEFIRRPPGFLPFSPGRGRTRCRLPLLVLPVRNGLDLFSSSFLV